MQSRRDDLPGDPEPVLEPAALLRGGIAALAQALPVVVDLGLVGAGDLNEIDSLNRKSGPPLRAVNGWPSSSKATVMTEPGARRWISRPSSP